MTDAKFKCGDFFRIDYFGVSRLGQVQNFDSATQVAVVQFMDPELYTAKATIPNFGNTAERVTVDDFFAACQELLKPEVWITKNPTIGRGDFVREAKTYVRELAEHRLRFFGELPPKK